MEVREPSAKYLAKPAYKQTEVGLIPEDWEVKPTSKISNVVRGGSPRPAGDPKYFDGSFIPWLTVASLTNIPVEQLVVSETATCLTEEGAQRSRTLTPGTLIIANSGATLGVAKILGIKCCANDGIAALQNLDKNVSARYVAHYINTQTKHLREVVATGNGQPNLNTGLIGDIPLPLPPSLAEQQAIAEALSDADALIGSLEQLLAKKRQIKQGAMQELLTGQKRLPGFIGDWETRRLDELGRWVGGMTPSMRNPLYWAPAAIPWISSGDVKTTRLFVTAFSISEHAVKERATTTVPESSIVVVMRSGILRNYLPVAMTMLPMAINQDVKAIIPIRGVSPDYLMHTLVCNGDRILSRCLKSGTTVESIEFPWLKAFGIPLPPIEEQTAISTILSDMDAEIAALEAKLVKAHSLKLGMMSELLTGRIRLV